MKSFGACKIHVFLLSAFVLLASSGCASRRNPQPPTFNLVGLGVDKLSFNTVTLQVRFELKNPNDFGVTVDDLNYVLDLNGNEVGTGEVTEPFRIKAKSEQIVSLPLQVKYATLMQTFQALAKNSKNNFVLKGMAKSGGRMMSFNESGEFELPIPLPLATPTPGGAGN